MKRWLAFLGLLSCFFILAGCENNKMPEVKVSEVTHSVFYAPFYIAVNQGFFHDEGIKLDLTTAQGADKVMTAVLANQADIGFMGPEAAMYVYQQGKDDYVQIFAQVTKRDGSFLVAKKSASAFSWEDVRGKKIIGGRVGGVPEMTLEYVLQKNGLKPGRDVSVDTSIQFALMAGAFTGGTYDYVTLFEPAATVLEAANKGYVVTSIGQESGEIPYTVFTAKKSFLHKNPELIQKFINALYRGQLWTARHTPEEIAKVIAPSFPDTDMKILVKVIQRYQEIDAWSGNPVLDKKPFFRLQHVMMLAGQLEQQISFAQLVDNRFAEQAIKTIR